MNTIYVYNVGMKRKQYTIRGIPEKIDAMLKQKAHEERKSLNTVVLEAIEKGIGAGDEPVVHHDMDDLAGSWVDDPEFDKAIEAFEAIDEELWDSSSGQTAQPHSFQ
jgi:hypothetical protein